MVPYPILFGVGAILFVMGIYLALPGAPFSNVYTGSIPPGDFYYYIPLSIEKGGRISGDFSETSGMGVSFYVFDQQQYTAFKTNPGIPVGLFSDREVSSGSYSVAVRVPGEYEIVLVHGAESEQSSQQFRVVVRIDGVNLLYLGAGLGVISVGAVLWVAAYDSKRKAHLQPWFVTRYWTLISTPTVLLIRSARRST